MPHISDEDYAILQAIVARIDDATLLTALEAVSSVTPPLSLEKPRLTAFRESRGLTQPELAAIVGVDTASISRWERGVHPVPPRHAQKLARALRVNLVDLLDAVEVRGETHEPA
jgi:DNA-binding transcriptional regulator YiaG